MADSACTEAGGADPDQSGVVSVSYTGDDGSSSSTECSTSDASAPSPTRGERRVGGSGCPGSSGADSRVAAAAPPPPAAPPAGRRSGRSPAGRRAVGGRDGAHRVGGSARVGGPGRVSGRDARRHRRPGDRSAVRSPSSRALRSRRSGSGWGAASGASARPAAARPTADCPDPSGSSDWFPAEVASTAGAPESSSARPGGVVVLGCRRPGRGLGVGGGPGRAALCRGGIVGRVGEAGRSSSRGAGTAGRGFRRDLGRSGVVGRVGRPGGVSVRGAGTCQPGRAGRCGAVRGSRASRPRRSWRRRGPERWASRRSACPRRRRPCRSLPGGGRTDDRGRVTRRV